jgi:hypothetical protein
MSTNGLVSFVKYFDGVGLVTRKKGSKTAKRKNEWIPPSKEQLAKEAKDRMQSDPVFAAAVRAFEARDKSIADRRRRVEDLRKSSTGLSPHVNAERWLRFVLEDWDQNWESFSDLEALVYLASRGREHNDQTKQVIRAWKYAEQYALENCAARDARVTHPGGTARVVGARPRTGAFDIENRSVYQLIDFWGSDRGPHPTEATLLRVVEWCGITGFEPWWNRFARETKEDILLGGPDPDQLIWWLFDMCRGTYALSLMGDTLKRAFDVVSVGSTLRRPPWVSWHDQGRESLAYASMLAWCSTRFLPSTEDKLVEQAVATLAKHQLESGGWSYFTDSEGASIEATALAVHAIAATAHPRRDQMMVDAARWLQQQQDPAGYWAEDSSFNPVHLTVLVLDALELASGGTHTTTRKVKASRSNRRKSQVPQRPGPRKMPSALKRFRVGLSFPGEVRTSVKAVANKLGRVLGKDRVFYDHNFKEELAIPDLDVRLQEIYSNQCQLVVIWACADYARKK